MAIQKTYQYKSYSPSGTYLGLIQNVITEFNYNLLIGTTFVQTQFTVQQNADVAGKTLTPILDEAGNIITDESGNALYTDDNPDIVGSGNANSQIAANNLLRVYEYSSYYPNGLIVFDGYISKWKDTDGDNNIVVTAMSNGTDMNQILVQTGDVAVISQTTDTGSTFAINSSANTRLLETFNNGSAFQISAVSLELTATVQAQLQVSIKQQQGVSPQPNTDPIVASGTAVIPIQTKVVSKISMNQPTTLNPAFTYYKQITWGDASDLLIFASNVQPYGSGNVYTMTSGPTSFDPPVLQSGYSLYSIIWQYGGNVTGTYTNKDPSFILTDIMANYASQGGLITPPQSTITSVVSQTMGDTSVPGATWATALAQILTPAANLTFNTVQVKLPAGATSIQGFSIYTGNPALDTVSVTSSVGTYILGGANALFVTPTVSSSSVNSNNGLATLQLASNVTLASGTQYYIVWFFQAFTYLNAFQGDSSLNAVPASPFGSLYTGLQTFNNGSIGMSKPTGIQALYMVLGSAAGINPNGGFSSTGTLTSYTFKMQTVLQAIQAISSLAPSTWYWYVDPATGILQFAQSSTTADITLIKGRHINQLDIEATKENIKNTAYFTGGDDGTATNTNILVKVLGTRGTNRIGLALIADNRVNSTSGGVVAARLIAQNFLNANSAESYISNCTIIDQTIDTNRPKIGLMIGFAGWGNYRDRLLLQVVGINKAPDQVALQVGTLPIQSSQTVADIEAGLAYQQTVANPSIPS